MPYKVSNKSMAPPHLVLIPSLGIGHLIPFMELSKKLAGRGFTISFLVTYHHLTLVQTKLSTAITDHGLDIRIIDLQVSADVDLKAVNSNSVGANQISPLISLNETLLRNPFENLLCKLFDQDKNGHGLQLPPPVCIVSDFFLDWTVTVAAKFGIPRVNVESSAAYAKNLMEILWTKLPRNLERTGSGRYIVPDQPKYTVFSASQMTIGLPEADESHPKHLFYKRIFPMNWQSWMTITNTFYELESVHIDHFQKRYAGPVRPIGPLLPDTVFNGGYLNTPAAHSAAAEVEWLDDRSHGSVVYVSFGSENSISTAQIHELALGLEASEKPFLWILRRPSDAINGSSSHESVVECLPEGFCRRTENRGRIVTGWTDQLSVLCHSSVGAFISHCGWNSTLEAIATGVPLICWPLFAEQPFNARFIVEEAMCGMQLEKGKEDGLVRREEIERVVRCMLESEDESVAVLKRNGRKLKELAKNAISEGGSSSKNFDMLVENIFSLQKQNPQPNQS
eukprot:Gb_10130 [translate_table: standard]